MTVLDAIIQSLRRAGEYNGDNHVAPAEVLWPDKERQWEPVLPVLRVRLPHLLTLEPYAANCKTGPAIWLRRMIGRTSPEANWPACASHADRPEKTTLLVPVSARKQLNDLPDDLITKVNVL
jgi:hypothetical protein